MNWRFAFNAYNLANTIEEEAIAFYDESSTGSRSRYRRTIQYYDARAYRFSINASF